MSGFFKLAEGMIAKQAQKQFEADYNALKLSCSALRPFGPSEDWPAWAQTGLCSTERAQGNT